MGSIYSLSTSATLPKKVVKGPLIVTDYPQAIKAFYMRNNEDGKTVAAMDVLVPRVGEIIGGSQREERSDVLQKKLQDNSLDPQSYWWYLELRKYGSTLMQVMVWVSNDW